MSRALTAYDHLWRGLGRAPTVAELAISMGVSKASAAGHLGALRRYGDIGVDGAPAGIADAAARAGLAASVPLGAPPAPEEEPAWSPGHDSPPLARALVVLDGRASCDRFGACRLDGRPARVSMDFMVTHAE